MVPQQNKLRRHSHARRDVEAVRQGRLSTVHSADTVLQQPTLADVFSSHITISKIEGERNRVALGKAS